MNTDVPATTTSSPHDCFYTLDSATAKQSFHGLPNKNTLTPLINSGLAKKHTFQSKSHDTPSSNATGSPNKPWHPFEAPQSPILPEQSNVFGELNWCADMPGSSLKASESRFDDKDFQSPDGHVMLKYQTSVPSDIRQQLLVQRTFNAHDDHQEPRTSSPMRKVRVCTTNSGMSTVTVSPSSGTMRLHGHNFDSGDTCFTQHKPYMSSPFMSPSSRAPYGTHDIQTIFKTPNRNQRGGEDVMLVAAHSHAATPQGLSPASTLSFTPGRQFVNPFEIDHDRLHMPIFSPNMFRVTSSASNEPSKNQGFWSVEQTAALMPVDIKEAEIRRQHIYQQKLDKEQDAKVQSAINKFFSNEVIVPSPWTEKVAHVLPRTPGSQKSVSCQTVMSVPPAVDLFAELEGKYQLPASKTEPSPASDLMVNSFIRRKLLHQLNDNDSNQCSPVLHSRRSEEASVSPSPGKQTTPEWEKAAANQMSSGHFSSSPIEDSHCNRGQHLALSETDLLASPELFPAGGGKCKSFRTSDGYYPRQDVENARTVMHLDFSSILDDPDDSEDEARENTGTMIQKGFSEIHQVAEASAYNNEAMSFAASHDSDPPTNRSGGFSRKSLLTSMTSTESTNDVASAPQTLSQDTGYQTASLQSMHQDCGSSSNLAPFQSLEEGYAFFMDSDKLFGSEHFTALKHNKNTSQEVDGSFLGLSHWPQQEKSSSVDDIVLLRKNEPCRIRKVRTLADIRQSKVSRDLTHSFNEEMEKSEKCKAPVSPQFLRSKMAEMVDSERKCRSREKDKNNISSCDTREGKVRESAENSDISMRSESPYFDMSTEKNGLNAFDASAQGFKDKHCIDQSTPFDFRQKLKQNSPLHDDTLQAARLLLEKSVELPDRFTVEETMRVADYFSMFQDIENQDPMLSGSSRLEMSSSDHSNTSTPTSRIFNSLEKKINQVEGAKLGSEIAAEIIKRAENDLAKLRNLGKPSPRT